jgi:aromatic-L-amino-acid decarboxylase
MKSVDSEHDGDRHIDALGDIEPAEFRTRLHQVADWIADYREHIETRRISPQDAPGTFAAALPPAAPSEPEPLARILDDMDRLIVPGLVHWGHPSFFGYFGSTTTAPGILGEMIAAALNVSAMTWRTSPAATELETVVLAWMRQMLGLPAEYRGVVYDTASVATLHALAAAREALGLDVRRAGLCGRSEPGRLKLYASDQAHSSIDKAAIVLGIGEANVVRIESDPEFRMIPAALDARIAKDIAEGDRPCAVVATVGTTSTTSVDPVEAIAAICKKHGVWLHVDAAYGGAMALLPEGRWAMAGADRADSIVVNPHKWLFVPLDFSALYTRRPEMLRAVFALTPEYLRGDASAAAENYMDYGIQLGRRFRALKAWMVFRAFGEAGLRSRIREHIRLARLLASWIEDDPAFETMAPVPMAVVCFRARPQSVEDAQLDALNESIVQAVNASGEAYLTHTRVRGRIALRIAIGNVLTTEHHVVECWRLIRAHHDACAKNVDPGRGLKHSGLGSAPG